MKNLLELPFQGEWKTLCPPGHNKFARDFVKVNDRQTRVKSSGFFPFRTHQPQDHYCWEQPVLSPIDGSVVWLGDGWPDNNRINIFQTIKIWFNATYVFRPQIVSGRYDIRPNTGNFVMIKSLNGSFTVLLAHLKKNSVTVKEGDCVHKGDLIGNVGNSGNSTEPHLHLNIFDQVEDPLNSKVLPFAFNKYQTFENNRWKICHSIFPKVGSLIKP